MSDMPVTVKSQPGHVVVNQQDWSISAKSHIVSGVPYNGPYEVTPTNEEQILSTFGRSMAHDITIAPIPSNYGLVTWDGTTLTIS